MGNVSRMDRFVKYPPLLKGSDARATRRFRNRFSPYKFALYMVDIFAVFFAFGISPILTGFNISSNSYLILFTTLIILAFVSISFFPAYNLYSYHRIFSVRTHLKLGLKAFVWSSASLFIILFLYQYPDFFQGTYFVGTVFILGMGFIILSRYFSDNILNVLKLLGISFISLGIIGLMGEGETVDILGNWWTLPKFFSLAIILIFLSRYVLVHLVFNRLLRIQFRRQVVIIGSDEEAKNVTDHIIRLNAPFWVAGFVAPQGVGNFDLSVCKERLCTLTDLPVILEENEIHEIIITDEGIDKLTLISLLDYCTSEGINVWFPSKLMPVIQMKIYIDDFCGIPMIRLCSQKYSRIFTKIKYALDAVITLPSFIILFPVFIFIGILIKIDSRGPVFYRATAVGRDGKKFIMYKFRSMREASSNGIHKEFVTKLIKGEIKKGYQEGGVLKITDDPRVTAVGRILRKTSLDELPQLINVLKGDMSLVGPRPCLPYEYEVYKDWHKKRLSVRPGITCLWQVTGRSDVDFEDMVLLDLYYVYNRSILMDMNIIYETLFAVLQKKGAY